MTRDDVLTYCLGKPGAWLDEPWEGDTVVKVAERIFTFLGGVAGNSIGVKCGGTREEADEWLARYPEDAVKMPYLGRSGWNTLRLGGAIPIEEIHEAIDDSYRLVVAKLPRRRRPPAP